MGLFTRNFLVLLITAVEVLVLARVLISYVDPQGRNGLSRQVVALTEPFLAPIRRALPATGMFDLSPLIVFIVLGVLLRMI